MNGRPVTSPSGRPTTPVGLDCHDEVCITCSDVAVAVRVRELLLGGLAVVDTDAGPEEVSVALVDAAPGDVVLVHAKEAIAVVERAR
ncbi:HypC/HybG/HupF family hydrogenase formation chaperone [Micromonospora sp. NPDC050200]|uniref:HypC/HybG/HupF family hydrogenase formation chaperone n=1 Tax=Micromonospora sp. NPDC050200 TaxID=3155664 RepID=UPI0033C9F346